MPALSRAQRLRHALLRRAFTLLYHQFAWAYDWVSGTFFRGEWRHWQRAAIPPLAGLPGRWVLEVGAGTGDLQGDLRAAGFLPVGIDLSAPMLAVARRKARRRGAAPLCLARAATQALPFRAAGFAGVVSTFPNEYIVDPRTLAEIARVLRPGGRLVIVPAGVLLPADRAAAVMDRIAAAVYGRPASRAGSLAARQAEVRAAFAGAPAFGPLVPRLRTAGFQVTVQLATRPASIALVLVATRPG